MSQKIIDEKTDYKKETKSIFCILMGFAAIIIVAIFIIILVKPSISLSDKTTTEILEKDLLNCDDARFNNATNIGDAYYCIFQNKSFYCRVSQYSDFHLKGIAFCEQAVFI